MGYQSERFTLDEKGRLKVKESKEGELAKRESAAVPFKLALTAEQRKGGEVAAIVSEVMRHPQEGNLDRLGTIGMMLKEVLGEAPENKSLYELLAWLGNLETQAVRVQEAGTSAQVSEILADCQKIPNFSELDSLSQLMAIYTVLGYLPKELVVEKILSTAAAAPVLFSARTAVLLEEIRKKDLESRGIDTANFISPIFAAKERIKKAYDQFGADSREARQAVEVAAAEIVRFLAGFAEYDLSVDSPLTSLRALETTGAFYAMCEPYAETVSTLLNWTLYPNPPASYTAYRELHYGLSTDEWLEQIVAKSEGIDHDHVMAQMDLSHGGGLNHRLVADQTTGHLYRTDKVEINDRRTDATSVSRVEYYRELARYNRQPEHPDWGAVCYGAKNKGKWSSTLADMASVYPELYRYARSFQPDDLLVLRSVVENKEYELAERIAALRKLVGIAPRVLGRIKPGVGPAESIVSWQNVFEFALVENEVFPALFMGNILSRSGVIPEALRKGWLSDRKKIIEIIGSFERLTLDREMERYQDILTDSDIEEINQAHDRYQQNHPKARREEKMEYRQKIRARLLKLWAILKAKMGEAVAVEREVHPDPFLGSLGEKLKAEILEESQARVRQLVAGSQQRTIDSEWLHLIEVKPEESAAALGRMLTGLPDDQAQKLLLLIGLVLKQSETVFLGQDPTIINAAKLRLVQAAHENGFDLPDGWEDQAGELGRGEKILSLPLTSGN